MVSTFKWVDVNGGCNLFVYASYHHPEYNLITCNLYHVFSTSKSCVQCTKMIIRTVNCSCKREIKAT